MNHAVIFTMYNQTPEQLDLSKQALSSIFAQDIPIEVWAIDNGSTDGTQEWLQSIREPNFTIVRNPKNVAPTKVVNEWLKRLFEDKGYDDVLSVPNDAILPPNCLRKMLEWPQGIVAALMDESNYPAITEEVKRIHGDVHTAVCLSKKWAYDELVDKDGYFLDEGMFMYASDCDLKVRLAGAGISTAQLDIRCWHYSGASHRLAPNPESVHRQADKDRDFFTAKWGFSIGSPEYTAAIQALSGDPA